MSLPPTHHLLFEQRVDVLLRRERDQIVDALADADVADRQLQVVGDRDGDATLGRAIELGEHDAVHAGHGHELARLRQAVLSDGRVEHEQDLVRRALDFARGDAADLVELGHQVDARVQPAGGVDETTSRLRALPAAIASNTTAAGSEPARARMKSTPARVAQIFELLDRGGAERIGGADERRLSRLLDQPRQLADGRGLAGAVDADDHHHVRPVPVWRCHIRRAQDLTGSRP